jgi:DNA helicase IV
MKGIQKEQKEHKKEVNTLKNLSQNLIIDVEKNESKIEANMEEVKGKTIETNNKIESINSRLASTGTLIRMMSENLENMSSMTKKGNSKK